MTWLAAGFRADAAARLRKLNTLAGLSIETSRASAVPDTYIPFIAIYTDLQENTLQSIAGSEPRFDAKLHLHVEPKVQATPVAAAEAQLDQIVGQILDGLLTDPDWVGQFQQISAVTVNTAIEAKSGLYTGLGRVTFTLEYVERYPPVLGGPLAAVDLTVVQDTQTIGATIVIPTS